MIEKIQIWGEHRDRPWWVVKTSKTSTHVVASHRTRAYCDGYRDAATKNQDEYHSPGTYSVVRASDYIKPNMSLPTKKKRKK